MKAEDIQQKLRAMANDEKASILRSFFKTGPGQYGEGDIFFGITVPELRKFSRQCGNVTVNDCISLLKTPVHEQRLLALLLLINAFTQGDARVKEAIFELYLRHARQLNNWDLVDLSAPNIAGKYLFDKPRHALYKIAESESLWERRISIIATLHFIRISFQILLTLQDSCSTMNMT